jgi:hypothetical protein
VDVDALLLHLHALETEFGEVKEEMGERATVEKAEDVADGAAAEVGRALRVYQRREAGDEEEIQRKQILQRGKLKGMKAVYYKLL